jgi:HTH-type transcriptional regulator/antitoxin HigA
MSDERPFKPNWISPPGETIEEILEAKNLNTSAFAKLLDESEPFVERLLLGEQEITHNLAEKLSIFLGSSQQFWLRREEIYRDDKARLGL